MGVFTYSFEPDTPAAKLPDHLPEEVKEDRRERADGSAAGDRLRLERGPSRPQLDVMLDRAGARARRTPGSAARYADAPDVDGVVYVTGESLQRGPDRAVRNRGHQRV